MFFLKSNYPCFLGKFSARLFTIQSLYEILLKIPITYKAWNSTNFRFFQINNKDNNLKETIMPSNQKDEIVMGLKKEIQT